MHTAVEFYESESGNVPVAGFLNTVSKKQTAKILRELDLLEQFGEDLHYPHTAPIKDDKYKGLQELRAKTIDGIFRIFYFYASGKCVLLHGIQKKTDKTPCKDLEVALQRMNDYKRRHSV